MKKQLTFFFFSLILGVSLQNCKFAKIDSVANDSFEVGFRTINAKARIIDYKDGTPTAHGHCYSSTVKMPEVGLAGTDTTETPFIAVDFESKIDSLIFDTEYFVRPYMRNGTQIAYGEVQKVSTITPSIVIKNFKIKRDTLAAKDSLVTEIITNEPLVVPNPLISREYGLVFCKTSNISSLTISNGTLFPTLSTNIVNILLPTQILITQERRDRNLKVQLNSPNAPNDATKVIFFSAVAGTDYYVRAYVKLNRGDAVRYYYSELITSPNQATPSLLKFKIK